VYFRIDSELTIYFVGGAEAKHSQHIIQNPRPAVTTRKAIQGRGDCRIAKGDDVVKGIALHNENFPQFKDRLTVEYILSEDNKSNAWVIKPVFISSGMTSSTGMMKSTSLIFLYKMKLHHVALQSPICQNLLSGTKKNLMGNLHVIGTKHLCIEVENLADSVQKLKKRRCVYHRNRHHMLWRKIYLFHRLQWDLY